MAKIHPQSLLPTTPSPSSSSCSSEYITCRQEVFTIWLKSLVFNSNGCTVFDSSGQIVYRIDNYDCKCSNEVYLMDLRGKVLFTILKKKLRVFDRWEGYRSNSSKLERGKPWFKVRKPFRVLKRNHSFEVIMGCDDHPSIGYRIEKGLLGNSTCKIVDKEGSFVAEVKQKQSSSGVLLGDDVLTLVVGAGVDHSLIMGLVVVYSLMNHNM